MENKNKKLKRQKREETRFNLWIIFLHVLSVGVLGLALFPMISFFYWVWKVMGVHVVWLKLLVFSFSIAFGYFIFGTALIFVCVLAKNIFGFRIKPSEESSNTAESKEEYVFSKSDLQVQPCST